MKLLLILLSLVAVSPAAAQSLKVVDQRFVLAMPDGTRLSSEQLVGAELQTQDGQTLRIDSVAPATEAPEVLIHRLSMRAPDGSWASVCDADAQGRSGGFPVAGRWDGLRFVKDADAWFLTCTSGSQAKCILWGYDPWGKGPGGEDLAPFYQACQATVRADYDGSGAAHTRDGTAIDVADRLGIQRHDTAGDPDFVFEAGWTPDGAACVAHTRLPDLVRREALIAATPRLGGRCDETAARARGALIFTRVRRVPATK